MRVMMSTDESNLSPEDPQPIADDPADRDRRLAEVDARTFRRWRRSGRILAAIVVRRIVELAGENAGLSALDDRRVRHVTALIIAAQRTMELENKYEQKVRDAAPAAAERDWREEARRQLAEVEDEVRQHIRDVRAREATSMENSGA